jgi:hypothetical protein
MSEDTNALAPAQPVPPVEAAPSAAPDVSDDSNDVEQVVNTEDSTPEESADPTGEPDAPKGRNRAEERIRDLVAERNAAKEYADYWREKALEGIRQPQAQQAPQAPPEPQIPQEAPTLEQFGYDQAQWSKAHGAWTRAQTNIAVQQALEAQRVNAAQQEVVQRFEKQVTEFRKDHPDFDTVMANPRLPQLDRVAAAMILSSDHSAAISYELGKDPALATRISRMNSAQQALAIGRLEGEVRNKPAKPAAPVTAPRKVNTTKAPAPPDPVPAGAASDDNPYAGSVGDFMKARMADSRAKRRGGRLV